MADLLTFAVCGAPLARRATDIAGDLVAAGWRVRTVVTPAAEAWVTEEQLLAVTVGQGPVGRREKSAAVVVAPISFNTVGKLAAGIADTPAHSVLCEALGDGVPLVAVPSVNERLWGHPAWEQNLAALTAAGVRWLSMHDGSLGVAQVVKSGTGDDLAERFDPKWIVAALGV